MGDKTKALHKLCFLQQNNKLQELSQSWFQLFQAQQFCTEWWQKTPPPNVFMGCIINIVQPFHMCNTYKCPTSTLPLMSVVPDSDMHLLVSFHTAEPMSLQPDTYKKLVRPRPACQCVTACSGTDLFLFIWHQTVEKWKQITGRAIMLTTHW